jgi:hypothetical protein
MVTELPQTWVDRPSTSNGTAATMINYFNIEGFAESDAERAFWLGLEALAWMRSSSQCSAERARSQYR